MVKILFTVLVLVAIYFIFFKKKKIKKQNADLEEMIECKKCGTFASVNDAIEKDGRYYCSHECLK